MWPRFFTATFLTTCAVLFGESVTVPNNLGAGDCHTVFRQERGGDYPFPTEMSFRRFCAHEISCTIGSIDPDKIGLGDTVFVQDWYIGWFLNNIHPKINYPYILITCDSADFHPSPQDRFIIYDTKIAAWFCKNVVLSHHPKVITLPCGQGIGQIPYTKEEIDLYLRLGENSEKEKLEYPLVYMNFNPVNHHSRDYIYPLFKSSPLCYLAGTVPRKIYHEDLARFKFTFAPRGQAIDTIRVWEAIGLNTIPIIEHSPLDHLYEGTPSVLVKNWEEINEAFLMTKYAEVQEKLKAGAISKEKATFAYWEDQIKKIQALIRSGEWHGNELETVKFSEPALEKIRSILLMNQPFWKRAGCCLFVYGQAMGLRALQLSTTLPEFSKIFFTDDYSFGSHELPDPPYNEQPRHAKLLTSFAKERYHFDGRIEFLTDDLFPHMLKKHKTYSALFMDLTHYRFNFTEKLLQYYQFMHKKTILCGNRATDPYVQDLLRDFAMQKRVMIKQEGDLWYFEKS